MVDFLAYIMIEFLNEPGIIARAGQAARQYADDKYDSSNHRYHVVAFQDITRQGILCGMEEHSQYQGK